MRNLAMAALAVAACTSTRMVERNGCWLKQSDGLFSGVHEELGFCKRPALELAQDRVGRLVQECIAQADYRWENRALAAWEHNQPIPAQDAGDTVAKTCMNEAAAMFGPEAENNLLKARLSELSQEREALRAMSERDREFFKQSNDRIVDALGEAAKKPAPAAVATATSSGTARTQSDQQAAPAAPASTLVEVNAAQPARPVGTPKPAVHKCAGAGEALACSKEPARPLAAADAAPAVKDGPAAAK